MLAGRELLTMLKMLLVELICVVLVIMRGIVLIIVSGNHDDFGRSAQVVATASIATYSALRRRTQRRGIKLMMQLLIIATAFLFNIFQHDKPFLYHRTVLSHHYVTAPALTESVVLVVQLSCAYQHCRGR